MVTQYDLARLALCASPLESLLRLESALSTKKGKPKITFYTLSEWAAAFGPEESPERIVGGYLVWYAQFRWLVELARDLKRKPVAVNAEGRPLELPLVETVHRPEEDDGSGSVWVATIGLLEGWMGESGLGIFGDPICASVAVHAGDRRLKGAAFVWRTGLEEPEEVVAAAEAWAKVAGAVEIRHTGRDEFGRCAAQLVPGTRGWEPAFPVLLGPSRPRTREARTVVSLDEARERLLARRGNRPLFTRG